jgi:radical SAM-linked protein
MTEAAPAKAQRSDRRPSGRFRVRFRRGEEVKYISHLDLMRCWERALRRAGMALAYSEGHTPHPRLALAAPLAVGVTSSAELLDVFLTRPTATSELMRSVGEQLPAGIEIMEVVEVGLGLPSLQSEVRWAGYRVEGPFDGAPEDVRSAVDRFLAAESIPWEHMREKQVRKYDIRALVRDLRADDAPQGSYALAMVLRCDNTATGRPEQVVAALSLPGPLVIHRRELVLAGTSPARQAWRRHGRFEQ